MLRRNFPLILSLIASCVMVLPGCDGSAQPSEHGIDRTPAQPASLAVWQPSAGFLSLANGEEESRVKWRAMHFKADLQEALRHFRRLEGRYPTSLEELGGKRVFFHLPSEFDGAESALVELRGETLLKVGQLGVVVGPESWQVLTQKSTAGDPTTLAIDLNALTSAIGIELTNAPLRKATSMAQQQAGVWAQSPVSVDGNVPVSAEKAANGFLFSSDAWEEARVRLLDVSMRTRLTTYVQCHGALPQSWGEVLALTGESPINYQALTSEPLEITDETVAVLLDVDREDLTARMRLKPRVPAVDTVYLQYRRASNGPGLERTSVEIKAGTATSFERLLIALITQ